MEADVLAGDIVLEELDVADYDIYATRTRTSSA